MVYSKNILSKSRGNQGLSGSRAVHSRDYFHLLSTAFTAFASYQHNIDVGSFRYNIGDIIILNQSHINVFKDIVSQWVEKALVRRGSENNNSTFIITRILTEHPDLVCIKTWAPLHFFLGLHFGFA